MPDPRYGQCHRFSLLRPELRHRAHNRYVMCALSLTATCTRTGTTCSLRPFHPLSLPRSTFRRCHCMAQVACTNEGFVSAHPRVCINENNSAGSSVGFELFHRSTEERPEIRFSSCAACSQGACATTKFKRVPQSARRPVTTRSLGEMSSIASVVKFHGAAIHSWHPALPLPSAAPQYL